MYKFKDFELRPPTFIVEPDDPKRTWPYRIDIVKWCDCEPHEATDLKTGKKIMVSRYCYSIGDLKWNSDEQSWDFTSCGIRYLEDGTEELNKWLFDFCNEHYVAYGGVLKRWDKKSD